MAAVVEEQRVEGYGGSPFKLSWGAIFGGTFVALGVWILLYSLGLAAGLTAIDPNDPSSARAAGIGTGIWTVIAPLIALFVGALVGARMAGMVDRLGGVIHGAVIWGVTTVAGVALVAMFISAVFGAATRAVAAGGSALGSVAAGGGQALPSAMGALGISADDLLGPVNEKLRSQGKPEVTADQLQNVVRDVAPTALRQGSIDREMVIGSVVKNTKLSREDAASVADQISAKVTAARQQAGTTAGQVQTGALKAAEATGKAFWGVFLALLLGLVSSVLGALVGVSRDQRAYAAAATATLHVPREAGT